jgi:phospholipid/cholesterol/gamma-HCH transport system substrate-binding protein
LSNVSSGIPPAGAPLLHWRKESRVTKLEIKPTVFAQVRVLLVLASGTVVLAYLCFLLIGGSADLLARKASITGYVPDATGVAATSEVRLSGIVIGKVSSLEISGSLDPAKAIRLDMRVASRYLKSIPADSLVSVGSDTLVGYKFIGIAEGKSPASLTEGGVLQSQPIQNALFRADLVGALHQDLTALDQLLQNVTSPDSSVGHFVMGAQEYDTVMQRVRGFDDALHTFLTPKSSLGQAFYSSKMYDQIHDQVTKADQTLAAIQRGEGKTGQMFVSDQQYEAMLRQLTSLHSTLVDVNAGKGKISALLTSDEDWQRVKKLLAATDKTISALNRGQGQAGRLLTNQQLYESLTGSLRDLGELLKQIREHPETYQHYKVF